jgi:hypothetical protein
MWANMAHARGNFKHNFELYLNKLAILNIVHTRGNFKLMRPIIHIYYFNKVAIIKYGCYSNNFKSNLNIYYYNKAQFLKYGVYA